MSSEHVYPLDSEALNLFASKGKEGGPGIKQVGNANGVKVRRMIQLTRDLAKRSFKELRILDLACGEGVYAIEAALRGAEVIALDARTERMNERAQAAERLSLKRLWFEQNDVRKVNLDSHGEFDVIYFLGILYHLDARDIFPVLTNLYEMCREFVVIDTHIALQSQHQVQHNGHLYKGIQMREHSEDDPESVRKSRLLFSLDNTMSFQFTKESLLRVLNDTGFSSVFECNIPREPYKSEYRNKSK